MKKNELYKIGRDLGIENNKIEKIVLKVTGMDKSQLFLCDEIDDVYVDEIKNSFERLSKGEPLEYVLNNAEFFSLDFYVDSRVLVPRNDTEVMVEKVLKEISPPPAGIPQEDFLPSVGALPLKYKGRKMDKFTLIDVGTGSSCIAISILMNTECINRCYVIDISKDALEVSRINIEKYGMGGEIEQIQTSLLNSFINNPPLNFLPKIREGDNNLSKNVIITANLPYVKNGDFGNMDSETIKYEPDLALYGGEKTGFELYEKLILECFELKKLYDLEQIVLFIEIGFDQKEVCEKYLKNLGIKYEIFKDNSGIERCVKIYM